MSESSLTAPAAQGSVSIRDVASKVHSSLSNSNYSVVRGVVGLADALPQFVPTIVTNKVQQIGSPMLDAADEQLSFAYTRIQSAWTPSSTTSNSTINEADLFQFSLPDAWFEQVDQLMSGTITKMEEKDFRTFLSSFKMTASFQFLALARSVEVSELEQEATVDDFVSSLKEELDRLWAETLVFPAKKFFFSAVAVYRAALQQEYAQSLTTRSLLERIELGQSYSPWERSVLKALKQSINQGSQLLYAASLLEFASQQDKSKNGECNLVDQESFIDGVRARVGAAWNDRLRDPVSDAYSSFSTWHLKKRGLSLTLFDRYQSLLLQSQEIFDRVLPPLEKEEKEQPRDEDEHKSLGIRDLASHVSERISERGAIKTISVASTNTVKEGVTLIKTGAHLASEQAHSVFLDPLLAQQAKVKAQLLTTLAATRERVEKLQAFLLSLGKKSAQSLQTNATSAAVTLHSQLPLAIQAGLTDVSSRLQHVLKYSQNLHPDQTASMLKQQLSDLSHSYGEVLKTAFFNNEAYAIGIGQELKTRIATLIEDAGQQIAKLNATVHKYSQTSE